MAGALAPELTEQVSAFDIDPDRTDRLARIYHRSVARVLWDRFGADLPGGRDGWQRVGWLHPRAVYTAALVRAGRPVPTETEAAVRADLVAGQGEPPPLAHLPGPAPEPWYGWGLDRLGRQRGVPVEARLRPTVSPIAGASALVDEAVSVLERVWPQAAAERSALLRAVVYCDGTASGSCTEETTFGACYLRLDRLDGVVAAFDTLVHETGYHALILRTAFGPFLRNGSEPATHPLRRDPRPLHGVLHAAHVLARMATGLSRWAAEPDAPSRVGELARERAAMLAVALETLAERAVWTPVGERYFGALCAASVALSD